MKYSEVKLGQLEALLNIVGGEIGLQALISNTGELEAFSPEQRQQLAFLQSYQKALVLRDFLRGWGKYGSGDGVSHFSYTLRHMVEKAKNCSQRGMLGDQSLATNFYGEICGTVEQLRLQLTEFQVREDTDLKIMGVLGGLKYALQNSKHVQVNEFACQLQSFWSGLEMLNDLFLAPVDKLKA